MPAQESSEDGGPRDSSSVLIPRVALFCVPIFGSFDTTMSRAAFTIYDDGEKPITPFALAVCRTILASMMFTLIKIAPHGSILPSSLTTPPPSSCAHQISTSSGPDPQQPPQQQAQLYQPTVLDRAQAAGLGLLAVTINLICFLVGVQYTDAITVAAMQCTVAPLCFLIGWYVGVEQFSVSKALCTLCCVVGNFLLSHIWRLFTGDFGDDHHTPRYFFGVLLVFGNAVSFAAYLVLQKPLLKKFAFVDFMWHVQLFGCIGLLFVALCARDNIVSDQVLSGELSRWSWATVLYTGCWHSVVTYLFLAYGIDRCKSPLLAALFFSLRPFLVVTEAVLFLGEKFSDVWQIAGGCFVILGLVFSVVANVVEARKKEMMESQQEQQQKQASEISEKAAAEPAMPKYDDVVGSGNTNVDVALRCDDVDPTSPHVRQVCKV